MGEHAWVINVNDEVRQMADITNVEIKDWERRFIYKLPTWVTDLNKNAYKPRAVSFGPYHYGALDLKPMEDHKRRALVHLLKRSGKPLECYVNALGEVVQDLKDAYNSLDSFWQQDTDAFLQLMVRDGCFMLEILRTSTQTMDDYAYNDPIFSNHGRLHIMPYIKRDMLMAENQLPMLVLEKLLAAEEAKEEEYLNSLVQQFCFPNSHIKTMGKCLHVLDLYRRSLLWEDPASKKHRKQRLDLIPDGRDEIIRSAAELHEAGIRIKKNKSGSLKDITFHGGILRLPIIVVDDVTESLFLNLIAFERFHVGIGNEITAYIFFMDNIIDNAKDVSLLHTCGIIQSAIGSDKAVAKLFNSLSKDVTLDPDSPLDTIQKEVNQYCKRRLNQWRANLIHTYFRNPWAILSVIAAIFLFALTIVQTVYSVGQYYQQNH